LTHFSTLLCIGALLAKAEPFDENILNLQAEASEAIARWKDTFVQQCIAKTPKVRVLAVADQVWAQDAGGATLGLCATAYSLKKHGGTPEDFGVLGLKHAGPENARTKAYWKWVFEGRLGIPRPDIPSDKLMKVMHIASLLVLDYLDLGLEDDNTIVIMLDAFDTLFQGSLDQVKQTFCEMQWKSRLDDFLLQPKYGPYAPNRGPRAEAWNEKVIFSAEENCYPWPNYHDKVARDDWYYGLRSSSKLEIPITADRSIFGDDVCFELERYSRGDRRFLNAGGIAARVKDLRNFLFLNSKLIQLGEFLDQGAYQRLMVLRPDMVLLDVEAHFFLNLHRAPKAAGEPFEGNCWREDHLNLPLTIHNHTPMVIHFNGNGKGIYNKCRRAMLGEHLKLRSCSDYIDLDNLWNVSKARETIRRRVRLR